jgi:hypothetical protein
MTQTNPTQAAIDLCIALGIPDHHAPTIQAAFAEREARLVGALEQIKREARKNKPDPDQIYATTLAALKDRTNG